MSEVFFGLFSLPKPDFSLKELSGSHSHQIAQIMNFYDDIVQNKRPDVCVVVGDVTSSLACALVASKQSIPIAHIEAGLRSGDRTMPEEINRIVIDVLSDILYTPSIDANENLLRENKPQSGIHLVGNIMIDSFEMMRTAVEAAQYYRSVGVEPREYGVVTFHRPANVDYPEVLRLILQQLVLVSKDIPLVFPIHPRTQSKITEFGFGQMLHGQNIRICDPLNYIEFMSLITNSKMVITDSGGVQEETTYAGITCLTVRENTERPVTISQGTNQLVRIRDLARTAKMQMLIQSEKRRIPDLWDGMTAKRIVSHLEAFLHVAATE
jgi:UDP-N-acetylglucosamine 2-epimerase (non-hydrolysing)